MILNFTIERGASYVHAEVEENKQYSLSVDNQDEWDIEVISYEEMVEKIM